MDTVKVDIKKLQILNDRISQTIEALNQVRLSVHGISHTNQNVTPGVGQSMGFGYGLPTTANVGTNPTAGFGYGSPTGLPLWNQGLSHSGGYGWTPNLSGQFGYGYNNLPLNNNIGLNNNFWGQGISHTGNFANLPIGYNYPNTGLNTGVNTGMTPGLTPGFVGNNVPWMNTGISHSVDPYWNTRVAGTFPYVNYQFPPMVNFY